MKYFRGQKYDPNLRTWLWSIASKPKISIRLWPFYITAHFRPVVRVCVCARSAVNTVAINGYARWPFDRHGNLNHVYIIIKIDIGLIFTIYDKRSNLNSELSILEMSMTWKGSIFKRNVHLDLTLHASKSIHSDFIRKINYHSLCLFGFIYKYISLAISISIFLVYKFTILKHIDVVFFQLILVSQRTYFIIQRSFK